MDSTEESDSRTAAFTKKRKQLSSLQVEDKDSDSGDKRLRLDALRSKYNTLEPRQISDTTSFSRRPSKHSATSDEGYPTGKFPHSGWTPINPRPATTSERPFKCDHCPQTFSRDRDLKKHARNHLNDKRDPFIDSREQGNAPGFDEGFTDGMTSTKSLDNRSNSLGRPGGLDLPPPSKNIPATMSFRQDGNPSYKPTRLRSGAPLSKEDYAEMARWLERHDEVEIGISVAWGRALTRRGKFVQKSLEWNYVLILTRFYDSLLDRRSSLPGVIAAPR